METLLVVLTVAAVFFVAGVIFGKRHAAHISKELAEAREAYDEMKAIADRLRG